MFIRNETGSYQGFRLNGRPVKLEPHGVTAITEEQAKDDTYQLLKLRGIVSEVKDAVAHEAIEEKARREEARAEELKPEVAVHKEADKNSVMMAQCCARQKNGEPCGANVSVPLSEYDAAKPYFCGRHKAEKAEDYEKVDGKWVKHPAKPKPAAKKAEPKKAEPKSEDKKETAAEKAAEALLR